MNSLQKDSWTTLKLAVDKYSQTTGTEIAVATTYFSTETALNDNHLPYGATRPTTIVYGHGNLTSLIKKSLDSIKQQSNDGNEWVTNEKSTFDHNTSNGRPISLRRPVLNEDPVARSLSSSYRTLKLDMRPPQIKTGASGSSLGVSPIEPNRSLESSKGGRRKQKRKKTKIPSGELELDENLLFGEEAPEPSSGEDSSDDTDDSDDDMPGHLPAPHFFGRNKPTKEQFATSLPVNINLWAQRNETAGRFRDNQGPRPVTFIQPVKPVQIGQPGVQEQTPEFDTMMASMQALARSVTDDSSLIFGERPRPRIHNETVVKPNVRF